ncbi:MAG: DUF131 domain-containing protein [Candidatus Thermoplasmatota archaeon]|nr:DUF131 domain-containing protein [Candidatus Thermoplasmatota archaeon]
MKKLGIIPLFLLIFGIAFLVIGYLSGELEAGLIIIFPILIGSGPFTFLGFVFIFLSVVSIFLLQYSYLNKSEENYFGINDSNNKAKQSIKGGGVVFIGPIPIVFGSSRKIAIILLIIAMILFFILFLFGKMV